MLRRPPRSKRPYPLFPYTTLFRSCLSGIDGYSCSVMETITVIAQTIQLAVAPVFLLAGIGAFLNVCAGRLGRVIDRARVVERVVLRSEEHTSELQSLMRISYAGFCLNKQSKKKE